MGNTEMALLALMAVSTAGFLLAEGERQRLSWLCAMRKCLQRMRDAICYEQIDVCAVLRGLNLRATKQERMLCSMLRACSQFCSEQQKPELLRRFAAVSAAQPAFGVLSGEDRSAFEGVLAELGMHPMREQLRSIDEALGRLALREETLRKECGVRCRMIRTLSLSGGAAMFLLLI